LICCYCYIIFSDIAERIDPEYAFGVRPPGGRKNKQAGTTRSKVTKHAAEHKRGAFEDIGEELI